MAVSGAERRVLIVDDSRTIQAMLDGVFSNRAGFRVVGFSSDAESAVEMIRRLMPDIVTIDLCMPHPDGAALLEMIGDLHAVCKIIVSDTPMTNLVLASSLLKAGASACVGKSELSRNPDAFFKKINAAFAAVARDRRHHPNGSGVGSPEGSGIAAELHPSFPIPTDETARLELIRIKGLANASRERQFDLITKHVARATAFPACMLTVIDRDTQWIKSAYGIDLQSTPRHQAFCNYTISQGGAFVVSDSALDDRFALGALVTGPPNIRSYAGHPVVTNDGVNIAALCVIDTRVRTVPRQVLDQLADMSEIIAELIDQRSRVAA